MNQLYPPRELSEIKKVGRINAFCAELIDTIRDGMHHLEMERLIQRKVHEALKIITSMPSIGAAHSILNLLFLTL
jgi:hypothetical protein